MLFGSNNDIGADELTTAWFKFLGASIAIILMAREAAPAELTLGQASADWTQRYGEHNKDWLEWTDTCVNCVRAQSGENFSCSNIGIACQPKEVTCVGVLTKKPSDGSANAAEPPDYDLPARGMTFTRLWPMSALTPKADIGTQSRNVRFVPEADIDVPLFPRKRGRSA